MTVQQRLSNDTLKLRVAHDAVHVINTLLNQLGRTNIATMEMAYLKVLQVAYKWLQPTRFEDLLVLEQRKLL
jgi:hypothetical protein